MILPTGGNHFFHDFEERMLIGVISDTHDRIPQIETAIERFNERQVAATLHCGDFVAPFSLVPFQKLVPPLYAVYGNNDGEKRGLRAMFEKNGWTLNNRPHALEIGGIRVAMLHEPEPLARLKEEGEFDLIVFGHTHEKYFEKSGKSMIVNPGEGCGWVKGVATAAIVDMEQKTCEFLIL